jgi:hypothetical protein
MSINTNFQETDLKLRNQLQFKCDLEQNTFWNLTLGSKVNVWKCVEIGQYGTENQKSALSHFRSKVETKHSNIQVNISYPSSM